MCAMGVLVALLERNASGKGQVIDCSMVRTSKYYLPSLFCVITVLHHGCMQMDSIVYLGALVFKLRAAGAWYAML